MPHRPTSSGVRFSFPARLLSILLIVACSHPEPFPTGEVPDIGPRTATPPIQLTYNLAPDRTPAWLEDGSGLAYSFQASPGWPDLCLAVLPAIGGTRRSEKCVRVATDTDSVEALSRVAPGPGSRAAWVDARSLHGRIAPDHGSIRVGSLAPGDTGTAVHTLPYLSPSGTVHITATHLGWLTPTTLTYVGADVLYIGRSSRLVDTFVVGREVAVLDLAADPPSVSIVANTSLASSVWPAADGTSLFYTVAGDSRIFQQTLTTGSVTVVHDFGARGIARDVTVRGGSLVAVVGGRVSFSVDPVLGPIQRDGGGALVRVDLATGMETDVPFPGLVARQAALSPDGRHLAVEGIDTLAFPDPNLWLLELP